MKKDYYEPDYIKLYNYCDQRMEKRDTEIELLGMASDENKHLVVYNLLRPEAVLVINNTFPSNDNPDIKRKNKIIVIASPKNINRLEQEVGIL